MALLNLDRFWPLPAGGWFRLLDYQVPLKATRINVGVGKIDLMGVSNEGRLVIIELKVLAEGGGRSNPPPSALMEALRYTAMVRADQDAIKGEAFEKFGADITQGSPIIVLLAPAAWWRAWIELPAAGAWGTPFAALLKGVQEKTGVATECVALDDAGLNYAAPNRAPRFKSDPYFRAVALEEVVTIGDALTPPVLDSRTTGRYTQRILGAFWGWADKHHVGELDGGTRAGRPPVLAPQFAARNVLVVEEGSLGDSARGAIRPDQRHAHFASLRSSQALAQSLFGAIQAHDRLDCLEGVHADCGRAAFFENSQDWALSFEHEIQAFDEPRPTSIDVLLLGTAGCVAIECKLTENEFGRCSRPRLRRDEPHFCDGGYHAQGRRTDRCALTSAGITYWDYLPDLFEWPVDQDQVPCRFRETYQLARNVMAACVSRHHKRSGHALIVYDANNPAFQAGGQGVRQWERAAGACLFPGLLRRLSWQRLLAHISRFDRFAEFASRLQAKYGLGIQ